MWSRNWLRFNKTALPRGSGSSSSLFSQSSSPALIPGIPGNLWEFQESGEFPRPISGVGNSTSPETTTALKMTDRLRAKQKLMGGANYDYGWDASHRSSKCMLPKLFLTVLSSFCSRQHLPAPRSKKTGITATSSRQYNWIYFKLLNFWMDSNVLPRQNSLQWTRRWARWLHLYLVYSLTHVLFINNSNLLFILAARIQVERTIEYCEAAVGASLQAPPVGWLAVTKSTLGLWLTYSFYTNYGAPTLASCCALAKVVL